jgi:hypothetical protein
MSNFNALARERERERERESMDHIAEWVRLTEEKSGARCATKPGAGRGSEGGLRAAVRELGIDRTEAQRA